MAHSKWVIHYPDVPHIWPVKVGTSLTQAEVEDLEAASFQIDDGKEVLPNIPYGLLASQARVIA
jgi:hypothetical protein